MRKYPLIFTFLSANIFICVTALAAGPDNAVTDRGAQPAPLGTCLREHYPNFKAGQAVWGYMPGAEEQEAICRLEFGAPEAQLAGEEVRGDERSPVVRELRKLWLMDRLQRQRGGGVVSIFGPHVAHKAPGKFLAIRAGARPDQVPQLDMAAKRQWVPDLLRTLDSAKAENIYYFRRTDEQIPAVCVEPGESGVCREIVAKDKYEQQQKKKGAAEEGGFKKFMKKVKDSVSGPAVREISEQRNTDFYGIRLANVAYAFDSELAYIGFFARVAVRRPFIVREQLQYVRDVFGPLVEQFGEPALKWKGPGRGESGAFTNGAVWLTDNGFRIDAVCDSSAADRGICRDGRIAVRRLPPVQGFRPGEGAGFFE
ncbi:MAG TPA: hypothetical protein VF799_12575 [Geobacteraceae bacterium]